MISTGNTKGAAEKILAENIFGGMCARVCPTEILCERACVRELGADCRSAVGVHAVPGFRVRAFAGATDGSLWVRDELAGDDPEALGAEVGRRLLAAGAGAVLG